MEKGVLAMQNVYWPLSKINFPATFVQQEPYWIDVVDPFLVQLSAYLSAANSYFYNIFGWLKWPGWLRGFIADYGVPLMVLVWTVISYIPVHDVPKGIPRRLFSPSPWSSGSHSNWTVIKVLKVCYLFYCFKCIKATTGSICMRLT